MCLNWVFSPTGLLTYEKNPLYVNCEPNIKDIKMRFTLSLLSILMENSHQNRNILNAMTDLKQLSCRNYSLVLSFGKTYFLCKIHSLNECNLNHNKQRGNSWLLTIKFRIKSPKMDKIIWDPFRENIFYIVSKTLKLGYGKKRSMMSPPLDVFQLFMLNLNISTTLICSVLKNFCFCYMIYITWNWLNYSNRTFFFNQ